MQKEKIKLYILEILLFTFLFIALIISKRITYITLAIFLTTYTILLKITIKKKKILSIYKKQIFISMILFGIIYIGLFYIFGFYEYDFSKSPTSFGLKTIYRYILPLTLIIITTEEIRQTFITQNGTIKILKKQLDISKTILFINTVLIDILIYIRLYDIKKLDDFLTIIGFITFASISCNMLYNYITKRCGNKSVIIYKLITILYIYIIPIIPNMYIYFRSFLRMIYPYIIYLIIENTYSKTNSKLAYKNKSKNIITIPTTLILTTLITMLISCQFKYGILVIGSESMTPTINIGDTIIYKQYKNQIIKKGDIIVFNNNGIKTIHRVTKIENINNKTRYTTKGDANELEDIGYITKEDIIGIKKLKIKYIGYPTIWIRELFNK